MISPMVSSAGLFPPSHPLLSHQNSLYIILHSIMVSRCLAVPSHCFNKQIFTSRKHLAPRVSQLCSHRASIKTPHLGHSVACPPLFHSSPSALSPHSESKEHRVISNHQWAWFQQSWHKPSSWVTFIAAFSRSLAKGGPGTVPVPFAAIIKSFNTALMLILP